MSSETRDPGHEVDGQDVALEKETLSDLDAEATDKDAEEVKGGAAVTPGCRSTDFYC